MAMYFALSKNGSRVFGTRAVASGLLSVAAPSGDGRTGSDEGVAGSAADVTTGGTIPTGPAAAKPAAGSAQARTRPSA